MRRESSLSYANRPMGEKFLAEGVIVIQKKFEPVRILFALAVAIAAAGCGKGTDKTVAGWFSESNAFSNAIADTGANATVLQGGMFAGGIGSMIDLTADQKQRIEAILEKFRPSQKRNSNEDRPSREERTAMRDSMKTARDSIKSAIMSVLTSDQKALLAQIKAQLKAGVVPDTLVKVRVLRLTSLLTLTPDQQIQAFTILRQEMQTRLDARAKDTASVRDSSHVRGAYWQGMAKAGPLGVPDTFLKILTDQQKQILEQEKQRMEKQFRKMRE
jgi:hypothetical protein